MDFKEWIINFTNTPTFDTVIGVVGAGSASLLALIKRKAIINFFKSNNEDNSNLTNTLGQDLINFYKTVIDSKEEELRRIKDESNKQRIALQEKDIAIQNLIDQKNEFTNRVALLEFILNSQEQKLKEAIRTIKILKENHENSNT